MALFLNGKQLQCGSADRNYSETTLWSGSETPSTSGTQITLSDNISNYDEIVFVMDTDYVGSSSFLVSALTIGESYISTLYAPNYYGVFWVYDSDTQITIKSQSSTALKTYTKVVGIKYGNGTKTFHNYSTAEQVVGTWIDGSTLYEKTVISTSELSKDAMNQIALGITDIDVCVSVSGFASYGSNNTYIPLPYGDKGNSLICLMNINKALSVANVWVGSDYTSPSTVNIVIITLQYTKSST